MPPAEPGTPDRVALVTGGARRIGAATCRALHQRGFAVLIHYHHSAEEANRLAGELNRSRPDSARTLQADLASVDKTEQLASAALAAWGRLDTLVNNASTYYPTPLAQASEAQWEDLMGSNLKGPFFLARSLAPALTASGGTLINIADINARRPLKGFPIYCMAKAANLMLTKSLALELAPAVRVNGIAPGSVLWPEGAASLDEEGKAETLARVPLQRTGSVDDIVAVVLMLATESGYLTGQVITVDGGASLAS